MPDAPPPSAHVPAPREERRLALRYALKVHGTAWSVARVAVEPFPVTVSDLSRIGMMLHTSAEAMGRLAVGDELLLGFPHPDQDNQARLAGTIVWKHRGLMNLFGEWSFGITFHDTPEGEVRKLLDPASRNASPLPETA